MGLFDRLIGRGKRPNTVATTATGLALLVERGIELHEGGRIDEAAALYRQVLDADPQHADALHLTGVLQHQRGEHAAALASIDAALRSNRAVALYHFNRGNVLVALGDTEHAAASFAEAARLKPGHAAAWFNLGKARLALKQAPAAVAALRRAHELAPQTPGLRNELCTALLSAGDEAADGNEGKALFREAAALLQDHWQSMEQPAAARLMFAYSLHQQGRWTEAEQHYRGVLAGPHTLEEELKAHSNLANTCNQLGLMSEAIQHYREALRLNPELADTASSIAACINYEPGCTPAEVLAAHRDWGRRFASGRHGRAQAWNVDRDPQRRLRIGYVSPDFRRHPVTALFAPVIERHDRAQFEVFCYYNYRGADAVTARIRAAAAQWRDVAGIEHAILSETIAQDGIDILVDLAGHTAHNRLQVFARKPAPLQVEWLGYYTTTGIDAFDYFISDPHCSPPGQEQWFSETLLRLPQTRFCYEPYPFMPEVNDLPAISSGHVTFGCFNNLAKLNPGVLRLWARILQGVPHACLVVQAQALDDAPNRERFAALAVQCGIAHDRLALRPFAPLEEAARAYHGIDIALDPFPFCGGMTSFESLWMGVPVVTREAALIAGRQTQSMLANLGLAELVGRDEDHYVQIAVQLAADPAALAAMRRELRPRFQASPLMDYAGFTAALEAEYRRMWRRWAGGSSGA